MKLFHHYGDEIKIIYKSWKFERSCQCQQPKPTVAAVPGTVNRSALLRHCSVAIVKIIPLCLRLSEYTILCKTVSLNLIMII